VTPIDVTHDYIDWLPSLNVRWQLGDGLYVRGAASRTVTRPDFNQLSPSPVLIRNSIDPSLNQGSAGNPELRPFRADNLDVAVEAYLGAATSVSVTGFVKAVNGFLATSSAPETFGGYTYQVTRPHNTNDADIRGFELAYQQFYDFLPGPLRGLGLQANYTYVDSHTLDPVLKRQMPLQNLSRNSFNLVGMYELDAVTARVAYNWRDRYFSGSTSIVNVGTLAMFTRAYGWLDASVAYRLGEAFSVTLEGVNLLRTVRDSRYGAESRRASVWVNDAQVSLSVAGKL
jgi:TonB-dependent receptor